MGKTLWSYGENGAKPVIFCAESNLGEAEYIAAEIKKILSGGQSPDTIAVLYRTNKQSSVLGGILESKSIPHHVFRSWGYEMPPGVVEKPEEPEPRGIRLMTLHAAKGLEFDTVFIIGVEDGLIPHSFSCRDPDGLEEERRLLYVGMTRAKKNLVLTASRWRGPTGHLRQVKISRFVSEITPSLLESFNCDLVKAVPVTKHKKHDRGNSVRTQQSKRKKNRHRNR